MPSLFFHQLLSAYAALLLFVAGRSALAQSPQDTHVNAREVRLVSLEVNDTPLAANAWRKATQTNAAPLSFSYVRSMRVHFKEFPPDNGSSPKLQYFLSGYDTQWHALRAHAQLTVRFLDKDGAIIGTEDLNANGESAGWMGTVANSELSPRSATLSAPPRCNRIQLMIISSVPEMIGQYALRDITLSIERSGESEKSEIAISTDEGVEMNNALGNPLQWARSGTRAQLAQVVTLPNGKHTLALLDNASTTFGAWILKPAHCPEVREGEGIVLNWSECFSLGRGGDGWAFYENLPPGNYKLLVAGQTLEGRSIPESSVLAFSIPPPFWERPLFWILAGVASTGCAFGLTKFTAKRRIKSHLAELERRHLLEKERSRIARDIHDELGASLAAIALMSTRAQQKLAPNSESAESLNEISKRAKQTARQLAEIVWAVNPARDSVENLVDFVCQFAQEHLDLANIRFRTEIPGELPELALSSYARHEAFLAAKELVHNAVRHGNPTLVVLKIECSPRWLSVEIEDNGYGFIPSPNNTHGGLANVAERMKKVGGAFTAHSAPCQGTRMQLCIPLSTTHG